MELANRSDIGHFGLVDPHAVLLFQRDHDVEDVGGFRAKILHEALFGGHAAAAQHQSNCAADFVELG
jgi:hypothetical protein